MTKHKESDNFVNYCQHHTTPLKFSSRKLKELFLVWALIFACSHALGLCS
jgi:hypothetical protein